MQLLSFILILLIGIPAWAQEIHAPSCLHGCPQGGESSDDLIFREIYVLRSNDSTKFAHWVAYKVTPETIGPSQNRDWKADPYLAREETLEPSDYKGAHEVLETNRGHQAPLASFSGTPHWRDTNFLSNITPQKRELNQSVWGTLENAVRDLAREKGAAFVMTGPLFEREMPELPNADEPHRIPSGYWKIVSVPEGKKIPKAAGFIFDQKTPKGKKICDKEFSVSIRTIEKRAGLNFFHALDQKEQDILETEPASPPALLGC